MMTWKPEHWLEPSVWRERQQRHAERMTSVLEPVLARASRGEKHPVEDFLFTYYPCRPALLQAWHPGLDTGLFDPEHLFPAGKHYRREGDRVWADPALWPAHRREGLRWIGELLQKTAGRAPHWACAGLHEWAMLYRAQEHRHEGWPLRVSRPELERTVQQGPLVCTHYDAFRFFTSEAAPLNRWALTRDKQPELEQPGCLHANMDLYKWAAKLLPFVSAEVLADCFFLAREIRHLDMRASPYDFTALGLTPVRVETADGRQEYEQLQRSFFHRAQPLRKKLAEVCAHILSGPAALSADTPGRG